MSFVAVLKGTFSLGDLPLSERSAFVVFLAFIFLFPWIVHASYPRSVMINFLLFAMYGMGWNLIGGYGGQVDLGQAKNVGFGAYATALMITWWGVPFWATVPVGIFFAVAESFAVAYPMFRLRGHYFAIATLCVALVWQKMFLFWDWTGGACGVELPIKPTPNFTYMEFGTIGYHYFIFGLFMAEFLFMNWLRKSKLGYDLQAVRDNEDAAASLGVNITWTKVKAYLISAAMGAVGGSFYAVYHLYIDPRCIMHIDLTILIAMTAMVGGAGSIWGPIIGAAILIPLDMYLAVLLGGKGFYGVDFMIYAFVIMVIAAREPKGIWGIVERTRRRRGANVAGGREFI
jgi:branched-chain amino acid transport system permease protein